MRLRGNSEVRNELPSSLPIFEWAFFSEVSSWLATLRRFSEKRRKPSPNAGGYIRRKANRALKKSLRC
ncbi:hypothetical protein EIF27_22550 [Escherichia coli]|nr:hypothetical protein [Escherichia coli]